MPFTVTRQHRWPDGEFVVEVTVGGFDYVNPDCLSHKFAGEGQTYDDPREAVEVAICIAKDWQAESNETIYLAMGNTFGMTGIFDLETLNEDAFTELRAKAERLYNKLPKCDYCQAVLPEKRHRYRLYDYDEEFCSENCGNMAAEYYAKINEEMNEETGEN